MALNKLKFNSINVTPSANKALKFNSSADGFEAGAAGGAISLIKKLTASSSSTLSFVDGSSSVVLDNTFKEYMFVFKNIHPQNDNGMFSFNFSADTGSNYNVTKTTSSFDAYNAEAGNDQGLRYDGDNNDLTQSTDFQELNYSLGNGNDSNLCGFLHLFNPSSTTFVKHFVASVNYQYYNTYSIQVHTAGYGNTTSAVDAVQFKMASGNIDAGTITLYGIN